MKGIQISVTTKSKDPSLVCELHGILLKPTLRKSEIEIDIERTIPRLNKDTSIKDFNKRLNSISSPVYVQVFYIDNSDKIELFKKTEKLNFYYDIREIYDFFGFIEELTAKINWALNH